MERTINGNKLVVTRHTALVQYLIDIKLIDHNTPVYQHVVIGDVRGKDVIGVLPMHLACHARTVTEVPLHIPSDWRGKELTLSEIQSCAGPPVSYVIRTFTDVRGAVFAMADHAASESNSIIGNEVQNIGARDLRIDD